MGMIDGGFNGLFVTDALVFGPVGAAVACLGGVDVAELERIDLQDLGQLVDDRLRSEGGIGAAGRAVGAALRTVHDNVVTVDAQVIQLVGRQNHAGAGANG